MRCWCSRNSPVTTAQTVWLPRSSVLVWQHPSRKKPVPGIAAEGASGSPRTLRSATPQVSLRSAARSLARAALAAGEMPSVALLAAITRQRSPNWVRSQSAVARASASVANQRLLEQTSRRRALRIFWSANQRSMSRSPMMCLRRRCGEPERTAFGSRQIAQRRPDGRSPRRARTHAEGGREVSTRSTGANSCRRAPPRSCSPAPAPRAVCHPRPSSADDRRVDIQDPGPEATRAIRIVGRELDQVYR